MKAHSTPFQKKFDPLIWRIVSNIPKGQVMGYGEIAQLAGYPKYSRMVSPAMTRCPEALPWYRVVRSNKTIAFELGTKNYRRQAQLLRSEGVTVNGRKVTPVSIDGSLDALIWAPQS